MRRVFWSRPMSDTEHLPLASLWEYAKNPTILGSTDIAHLVQCEDCVAILWLSRTANSVADLEMKLKQHGSSEE